MLVLLSVSKNAYSLCCCYVSYKALGFIAVSYVTVSGPLRSMTPLLLDSTLLLKHLRARWEHLPHWTAAVEGPCHLRKQLQLIGPTHVLTEVGWAQSSGQLASGRPGAPKSNRYDLVRLESPMKACVGAAQCVQPRMASLTLRILSTPQLSRALPGWAPSQCSQGLHGD